MMPRNPALRRRLQQAAKLALSVAALVLTWRLIRDVPFDDLKVAVADAHPLWIAAAVLLLASRMPVWAWRWGLAVRHHRVEAGSSLLLPAIAGALAVNQITPAARILGGVFRARWLQRFVHMDLGVAFGTVLYDQVAHQVVMTTATLVSVVVGAWLLGRQGLAVGVAAVLIVAVVILGTVLWRQGRRGALIRRWGERLAGRLARADDRAQRLVEHSKRAFQTVRRLLVIPSLGLKTVSLGLVLFTVQVLAQLAVFRALGSSAPVLVIAVVVALGTAAGMLLGTPGGLGTTEAAMIAGFAALGVGRVEATAATLVYRSIHYAVLLVLGLPAFVWLELRDGPLADVRESS